MCFNVSHLDVKDYGWGSVMSFDGQLLWLPIFFPVVFSRLSVHVSAIGFAREAPIPSQILLMLAFFFCFACLSGRSIVVSC